MTQMILTYPAKDNREQELQEENRALREAVRQQKTLVRVLAVLLIIASLFGTVTTLCDMADRERETIGATDARGRM